MSIYHTAGDRTPFTYLLGWSKHNKWYYGVRYAKKCHPNDLWTTYFTSSRVIAQFCEIHGDPDIISIRRTFLCINSAKEWEDEVLMSIPKDKRHLWLNKRFGTFKGIVTTSEMSRRGHTNRKPDAITLSGYTNEYRKANGFKLIPGKPKGSKESDSVRKKKSDTRKGKVTAEDHDGRRFLIDKNDPRLLTGELINCNAKSGSKNKGRKHSIEAKQLMSDFRKGKAPWNKGKRGLQSNPTKGQPKPKSCCIVCRKEVDQLNLGKYHKHLPNKA